MSALTGKKISQTYEGLLKTSDETPLSATPKAITDGLGNSSGVKLDTGGNLDVTGIMSFGSIKDRDEDITINKLVDETDGIANNNDDTSLPTSAAVKDYVDQAVTAEDLDFSGNSGTGDVDLDSEAFEITGSNGITTTALNNTLDIDGSALEVSINTNTLNISSNAADISQNENDIAANAADITTNQANISTNATDIAANSADISTNTGNISNKVNKSGDTMSGDLNMSTNKITNFASTGIDDNATSLKMTLNDTGLGIGTTDPNRVIHVVGNSRFDGNILIDKSTARVGVRMNDPFHPVDVSGRVGARDITIGTAGEFGTRKFYSGQLGSLGNNQNYLQMADYGQGNLQEVTADIEGFDITSTPCFSSTGRLMEDYMYLWVRVKPSYWGVESVDGQYKATTLLTAAVNNEFVLVDEILVIDNKDNFNPNTKGNFTGPDAEPWISFFNNSGQNENNRQIGSVLLGTYRNEVKKWAYIIKSNQIVQAANNYHTTVQRAGNSVIFNARTLNTPTIRPSYNVEFRIKYKRFKTINLTGYNPTTLE